MMSKRALLVVAIALSACPQPGPQTAATVECASAQSCLDFGTCDDGKHYEVDCDASTSPAHCRCVVAGVVGASFDFTDDVQTLCGVDVSGCAHFSNEAQDCLDDTHLSGDDANLARVKDLCGFDLSVKASTIPGRGICVAETDFDDADGCEYLLECPTHSSLLACDAGGCTCDSDGQTHTSFTSDCATLGNAVTVGGDASYVETNCGIDGVVF